MSTCSYFLPPIFINKFFSAENTGYFDLSKLLLSIPLALVASSLSNVILQSIAEKYQKRDSFVNDLKPVFFVVTAICITELLVILLFGIGIFKFAFGDNWGISGEISKIMVWSFAFNFFVSSFSSVFISMQKIKTYSIWQFFYFLSIISLLFFKNLAFIDFLKVYVLIEIVCYFVLTGIMVYIITRYELSLKSVNNSFS
jgi:O-antigen/teichoic acid export membrane protein